MGGDGLCEVVSDEKWLIDEAEELRFPSAYMGPYDHH